MNPKAKRCRCGLPRKSGKLFCLPCWRSLPYPLQHAVIKAHSRRPYNRVAHLRAIRACIDHLRAREKGAA